MVRQFVRRVWVVWLLPARAGGGSGAASHTILLVDTRRGRGVLISSCAQRLRSGTGTFRCEAGGLRVAADSRVRDAMMNIDYELLLSRHATRQQAGFFLSGRGQRMAVVEEGLRGRQRGGIGLDRIVVQRASNQITRARDRKKCGGNDR